ncbi:MULTISPECIES: amino acid ABC transporter ATP-binding protein [Enterococcaceae]|uniref:amino acid ABC transporter ATP-binding protein n=1 Tax=Enterococcaceae TaxID=81852 RepID=UPI000E5106F8|nr:MULTISPECIES: amino acid ABC transporter ATP-binding protein [Enterococcaceae]MCI0130272.1 amino acid ABC transporter ATP-binding protein [Vagococcus sp. CY53-2]RGI31129.1 amino acid ABC transporter ATP-binding protein [Melissococcus sp. OM08-11BH]UNM89092.1 amino acid ABC transporter ATP-binding protein [Vagococcus sp. CY52-2]
MLEIKNVSKSFGEKKILDEVSYTFPMGEITVILGPSGGGKTTLLRCISGLETFDGGTLLLDEEDLTKKSHQAINGKIGVVFQDFQLFPHLNVLENIVLAPTMVLKQSKEEAEKTARTLLITLGLEDKEKAYPFELSGGQKQRVAIARALAMKPRVLCYDEPTSALDPGLSGDVAEVILNLKSPDVTQIVVTHDPTFAERIADNTIRVEPIK